MLDFRKLWDEALPYERFIAECTRNCELWTGVYRLSVVPVWALESVPQSGVRLLVLVEDWCGDASNTVPIIAKLAAESGRVEFRVLRRDEYPEVMNQYLTNGSRSIPIVIALDESFQELGHWGPRPAELQAFVMANKGGDKTALYPKVRRWYARDGGATTLREVLAIVR
ncbi:MAG: thioredoxin family protein [Gemmatimonadales bacterium]|nr:thioredoxin family protein [Gemmatimonadales bacterium]